MITPENYRRIVCARGHASKSPIACDRTSELDKSLTHHAFQKHIFDGYVFNADHTCVCPQGIEFLYWTAPMSRLLGVVCFQKKGTMDHIFNDLAREIYMGALYEGAIHTILNDASAEVAKLYRFPISSTRHYAIERCETILPGIVYDVEARIDSEDGRGSVIVTSELRHKNLVCARATTTIIDLALSHH